MSQKPLHAARLPSATTATRTTNIDRQLRRRVGIPRKTRKARNRPPLTPGQPRPFPRTGAGCIAAVAAVVFTVMVAVPLVGPALKVTVELPSEQLGRLAAFVGEDVSLQVSVITPAYPVVEVTVIVEVAEPPAAVMAAGVVAARVKSGLLDAEVTVTFTVVVCVRLPAVPVIVTK